MKFGDNGVQQEADDRSDDNMGLADIQIQVLNVSESEEIDRSSLDATSDNDDSPLNENFSDHDDNFTTEVEDEIFKKIQDTLNLDECQDGGQSPTLSEMSGIEDGGTKTADEFTTVPYGFQPRAGYEQSKKLTDIMGSECLISNLDFRRNNSLYNRISIQRNDEDAEFVH